MTDEDVGPRRRGIPPTRRGYPFDEAASALQKSIRRGLEAEALYWALELADSGYTQYVWRRLLVIVSEEVGLAAEHMPATIWALHQSALHLAAAARGRPAGRLQLVHAVLLLSRSRKSRIVPNALIAVSADETVREIPDVALDQHTKRGRAMGRGREHFFDEAALLADPETGELTAEGALPDAYLERARTAAARQKLGQPRAPKTSGPLPEPERQMTIDDESEQ